MSHEVRYLLFDVESVADGNLIAKTMYPSRNFSAREAISHFRQELLLTSGRDFIPYTFQLPVAVVVANLRADYSLIEIVSLDQPEHRPHIITRHFWTGWEAYGCPAFVSFNGRTFDIPLMEHAAFRYGLPVPKWSNLDKRAYEQCRNRYNMDAHIDVQEILTNYGATWFRGGLNLAAAILGKPGKMNVQGDMVYDLYCEGKQSEINEYCRCDVLDTYFVFLRTCVLMGQLTIEQEHEYVESTRKMLEQQSAQHPAYQQYLENWGEWINPWLHPERLSDPC